MFQAARRTLQICGFLSAPWAVCGTERQHDGPARFTTPLKTCDFLLMKPCETFLT